MNPPPERPKLSDVKLGERSREAAKLAAMTDDISEREELLVLILPWPEAKR